MDSPESVAMQVNADSPQDSSQHPSLLTDSNSCQMLNMRYKGVTHEEVCYIAKEQLGFSNLYEQKSRDHVWE
jgi:hypothetical protein